MKNKELLIAQFNNCYDTNGWFVAVRRTLDGVTAEQAAWKPEGTNNSIWESMTHLTFYNNAYLQRFKGVDYKYDITDNDETFRIGDTTVRAWQAEVAKFDGVMTGLRELINAADDLKFSEQVSATNTATWAELIANVNAHNAYHGGQILLLRKLQGSWDPAKGVN
ncbi:MAG: DinB family protein [Pyrinomonadaceae bacterium]